MAFIKESYFYKGTLGRSYSFRPILYQYNEILYSMKKIIVIVLVLLVHL